MTDHLNILPDLCKQERYKKVAVALSGGVDSTAAAILLKKAGHKVIGLSMQICDRNLKLPPYLKACFGPLESESNRINYTREICERLGIPLYLIDLRKEFRQYVIEYFRKEYLSGKTPNPCVRCNLRIKFGLLLKKAQEKGIKFDFFATGHHARIEKRNKKYILKKGNDKLKDQSYFLYALTQNQLSRVMFPAGNYKKDMLKIMVSSLGLAIEEKKESQDFISQGSYSVLFDTQEIKEGPIIDRQGKRLGTHKGIIYYTIGQRKGLGISSSMPLYVVKIDAKNNTIVVSSKEELFSRALVVKDVNLIAIEYKDLPLKAKVKIRRQHTETYATLYPMGEKIIIIFDDPQPAITPGQSAVFYSKDVVLGGGIIESPIKGDELWPL